MAVKGGKSFYEQIGEQLKKAPLIEVIIICIYMFSLMEILRIYGIYI